MVLGGAGTGRMTWVPAGRIALAVLFLVGLIAVLVAGSPTVGGVLMLSAFFVGTAGAAAWVWRRSTRDGDQLTVRSIRGTHEVTLASTAGVEIRREGSVRSATMKIVVEGRNGEAVLASFAAMTAPAVLRQCQRAADALRLPFEERRWRDWLEGRQPTDG